MIDFAFAFCLGGCAGGALVWVQKTTILALATEARGVIVALSRAVHKVASLLRKA